MNQVPSRYLLLAFGFLLSIPPVSSAQEEFIHPGLLHSRSDVERMKVAVLTEKGPIFEGFKVLEKSS